MLEIPRVNQYRRKNTGRFCSGTTSVIRTVAPLKIPEAPKPARARPRIKTGELGAAPQRADPASHKIIQARKTFFAE
jgi:hypothetical protein